MYANDRQAQPLPADGTNSKEGTCAVFQPGWSGNHFVFLDGSHAWPPRRIHRYQTATPRGQLFKRPAEPLKTGSAGRCIPQRELRLILAVATALTGPVIPLLNEESGGFHFAGDSSCGKTTALYPACSVWGPPATFINRWRATANGIEAKAVLHKPHALRNGRNEPDQSSEAGEVVYMLANGQGKLRAQQDGSS